MNGWVTVARVLRSRGVAGEVVVEPLSMRPERIGSLEQARLSGDNGVRQLRIERAWEHAGRWVLKFEGVDSVESAETLRGCEVQVPESERIELEPGEYFFADLVGCELIDARTGERLGVVDAVEEFGGPPLLRSGELLVPFAKAICKEIDVNGRRIVAELPEGLRELG